MRQLQRIQQRAGGGGGMPPRGTIGLGAAAVLGATGIWVVSNSLFNVDGGHRAIKYRRISGVSKEIFGEGMLNIKLGKYDKEQPIGAMLPLLT